jgi:hypothetical protein
MKILFNIFSALNVPDNRLVYLQHYSFLVGFRFFLHKKDYDSVNWDAFIRFTFVNLPIFLLFRDKTLFFMITIVHQ